jgi:pimeloyl-ACP methyl ester carboxylesterase
MKINSRVNLVLTLMVLPGCAAELTGDLPAVVAGSRVGSLAVPGGTLAFEDSGGDGPVVLCVPGIGDTRAQYRFLAPRLVAAGYRVVALDLRGLGGSSAEFTDYSAQAVGGDMLAVAQALDAGPVTIIGNSMAAAAAVWAAAEKPALVERVVLIGPFVRDVPVSAGARLAMAVLFARPWGPSAWGSYYASLYPTQPPADLDDYRAALVAHLRQPGRWHAVRAMLAASKATCSARIAEVKAPVLVIMGERDPDFDDAAAEAQWVATALHGSAVIVPGAGHYPHAEMPEKVAGPVLEFLAGRTAAATAEPTAGR